MLGGVPVRNRWGLLRSRLVLAALLSGLAAEASATDVSNHAVNPYAYRTIAPATAGPARPTAPPASPIRPSVPRTAALPMPDNEVCVGLCRLFELMWRLERPGSPTAVPTS